MELKDKWVVITGSTSGIGLATAKAFCKKGAHVIGIGRSSERCQKVSKELSESFPEVKTDFLVCDLSSMKNVRGLADEIRRVLQNYQQNHIDVLINNAGTFTSWYMSTTEGLEMQFAVNYLATFLLTHLLLPLLSNAIDAKIINLSSGSHYHTRIHWNDVLLRKHYNCLLAYKQTKLEIVLFCCELRRRLGKETNISVFAADPGLVNTDMGLKSTTGLANFIWKIRKKSGDNPEIAAESLVFLSQEENLKKTDEIYFKACKPKKASRYALDEKSAIHLWEISERMCGINVHVDAGEYDLQIWRE